MPNQKNQLPGSFYQKGAGWYWDVRLPDETKHKPRALIEPGGDRATEDRELAQEIARELYVAAKRRADGGSAVAWDGTIGNLAKLYLEHCQKSYRKPDGTPTTTARNIGHALKPLLEQYAKMSADAFGPLRLKEVRQAWIDEKLCRTTINDRVRTIQAMFRWAVGNEMLHGTQAAEIGMVDGIHKNRVKGIKEPKKVKPVSMLDVERTAAACCNPVATMIRLQAMTGMRPTEMLTMTPGRIDRSNKDVWVYTVAPEFNKTDHLNEGDDDETYDRRIPLVGEAQRLIAPFMFRKDKEFLFTPEQADREHRKAAREARTTGLNKNGEPYRRADGHGKLGREFASRYTADTYHQAIDRAIIRANKGIMAQVRQANPGADEKRIDELYAAQRIKTWYPYQLRHTAGTLAREAMGIEAASALLGHKNVKVTELYAEKSQKLAAEVAKAIAVGA